MVTRLLTVCLGNICRSPTAAAALEAAAAAYDTEVEVASAGTGAWHLGAPPDARMRRAATARGLTLTGTAELATAEGVAHADLVLAMDADNLHALQELARAHDLDTPIVRFRTFDPGADPEVRGDLDVPDPYYGGPDGFDEVVELCRRSADALVRQLAAGTTVDALERHHDPLERPGR